MTIESTSAGKILVNVEILRFVAAFLVLVEHLLQAFDRGYVHTGDLVSPVPLLWRSGVDIFFVISGFIMLHVTTGHFGSGASAREFLARRVIRIVPMYWLFTTAMIAAALVLPGRVNNATLDPVHVILSYFFIPWPRPDGGLQPPLGPGWTLNYEMFFYAIFAAGLLFRRTVGLAFIGATFLLAIAIGQLFGSSLGPFVFWTHPMILEFLFGIALGAVFARGVRLGFAARILLIGAGLALGSYAEINEFSFQTRWLWAGVPALLIAAGVILGSEFPDGRARRWLILGGGASYVLYLSHLFTLKVIGIAWEKAGIESSFGFLLVAGTAALGAAVLIHLYVEKPVLRASRRFLPGRPKAASLPATASP
ncbi:MAG TPA: acyltransferase [Croceibacterium sp.]